MSTADFGDILSRCVFVRSCFCRPVRSLVQRSALQLTDSRAASRQRPGWCRRRPNLRYLGQMLSAADADQVPSPSPCGNASLSEGFTSHIPVLADAVLGIFKGRALHDFVDGTLGAGGHAALVLAAHPELETLVGIDRDTSALELASTRLAQCSRGTGGPKLHLLRGNFRDMIALCRSVSVQQVDGILLDLGVSSMQLDQAERGFSFGGSARARAQASPGSGRIAPWDAPLDMRMDQRAVGSLTARDIVNTWSEADLIHILREYGEEPRARQVARRIVEARARAPIETTGQLATLVLEAKGVQRRLRSGDRRRQTGAVASTASGDTREKPSLPVMEEVGIWYRGRDRQHGGSGLHPATLTFQALRIAVNDELESLRTGLHACLELLRPGGRLAVISFHRLEDRIVKWTFRERALKSTSSDGVFSPRCHYIDPTPQTDDEDEDLAVAHQSGLLATPSAATVSPWTNTEATEGSWRLVTKKPIVPTAEEIRQNPRCRSAKLRAIEKLGVPT